MGIQLPQSWSTFNVPQSKELIIMSGDKNILSDFTNTHLIIDDGISLDFKNNYTKLMDVKASSLLNLLANSITLNDQSPFSSQNALQGLEAWESTDVLSFSVDVTVNMVESGLIDVVNPVLLLVQATLPEKDPNKQGIWGNNLIPPGPNIAKILALTGEENAVSTLQKALNIVTLGGKVLNIDVKSPSGTFDVQIGKYLTISNVVITTIQPTFSEQLDEDYCPVNCKLNISFQTVEIATKNMIRNILQLIPTFK